MSSKSWLYPQSSTLFITQYSPTLFERKTKELGLETVQQMEESAVLKTWVEKIKDDRYVPEALLKKWHMEPSVTSSL